VDVCACIRAFTHTLLRDEAPGPEGLKNLDRLNLGKGVFVHAYKVHMCTYMLGDGMRSWTNCFFS